MFSLFAQKAASLLKARFFLPRISRTIPGRRRRLLALSILIMLLVSAIVASSLVYENIYRIAHLMISPRAYAAGPVVALGFNEGSGTTTADASGNGNTGTLVGGVTWTTAGKYGGALSFDGSSGVVRIPDSPSWKVDGLTGYTVSMWVKVKSVNGDYRVVLGKGAWPSDDIVIYKYQNQWQYGIRTTGLTCIGDTVGLPYLSTADNTYHHIAVSMDTSVGQCKFYSDGAVVDTDPSVSGTTVFATGEGLNNLYIGGLDGAQYANMDIDEVRIYTTALTQAEIQTDMNTPIGGGSGDTTTPVISGVSAGNITTAGATITWTTNENSDSQVEYGTSTAYGQTTTLSSALVTAHSQGLSGLSPGTAYHYRVKSKDGAGNLAVSGDFSFTTPVPAQIPNIDLIPVSNGLSSPLYLASAHDGSGRLFIVEQPGRIKVILPGASTPLAPPFLDITSKVLFDGAECGLLGLAFHPQYSSNRRFFVNYTREVNGAIATVISEFTASASNPNIAETNEKIILTIPQPPYSNNKGGMIEFGLDGYLYIGMGDGGAGYDPEDRAQNIDELLGKILRIDVDHANGTIPYSSPSNNPFFGATPGRDEIYALGFRNPFRFSFDSSTGQLYAGDVGEETREEIDLVERGGNYGWKVYEGTNCTTAPCDPESFIRPIYEYDHSNGGCAVIGGYVYRGTQGTFPSGSYIFGDYCTGEIFIRNNNTVSLLKDTDLQIVSFGEDQAGELYVISLVDDRFYLFRLSVPPPQPTVMTASQASYSQNPIARESLICGFGYGLANSIVSVPEYLYTNLGGATVTVRDSQGIERAALINYVSPPQINFHLPVGTALGNATITYTNTLTGVSQFSNVTVGNVNPGIFSFDGTGSWMANAQVLRKRQGLPDVYEPTAMYDGNQWVPIPIDLGPPTDTVILVLFGTGWRYRSDLSAVSVTVGGTPCFLFYAGVDGSERTGMDQANVLLPRSLAGRGLVDIVMKADGLTSNTVKVSIR